jgi:exosortase/archaeosortase family protein
LLLSWTSVSRLLTGQNTGINIALAHAGLILSVFFATLGCLDPQNIWRIGKRYKKQLMQAAVIAGLFYLFLLAVYALWKPLAAIVLVGVHGLLSMTSITTEIILPNTLLTSKFGITIAEYCSGIESIALFSGLYLIVGLLDMKRLNMRRYLMIFPLALALLFALNILRVFGLIAAGYSINQEIAFSLFHTYAGMVFFILYSAAFWTFAYKFIVNHQYQTETDNNEADTNNPRPT